MSMKTYSLVIVYDDTTDTIEYIEEEISEDVASAKYNLEVDPNYYDDDTLVQLIREGIIGES